MATSRRGIFKTVFKTRQKINTDGTTIALIMIFSRPVIITA